MTPADFTNPLHFLALPPLAQQSGSFWLPPQSAENAWLTDNLFTFLVWLSVFFFSLICGLMVLFVIRYRRRPGVEPQPAPDHSLALELTWSLIPLALVIFIFAFGFAGYMELRSPPSSAFQIDVLARKWSWMFTYPDGTQTDELHVPVNEPVRLVMTSDDVIHSLFIPAFRVKMDVVPGRYTRAWFSAVKPGRYDLFCTEYCGRGHSDMLTKVVVHPPGEFRVWLKEEGNFLQRLPPAEAGEKLYRKFGCGQCHSTDGTARVGPSFKGIYAATHRFTDGSRQVVDENYIRQSILEPGAKVRQGFKNQMSPYKGHIKDEEITAIIAFIKTLQ